MPLSARSARQPSPALLHAKFPTASHGWRANAALPWIHAHKTTLLVAAGVTLVVIGLWGLYGPYTGMSEGELTVPSDLHPGFKGFLFFLPERRFTSLFYHLSYLIGAAVGERGSFVPYQLTYAVLWALRGLLTYLIVRKLAPEMPAIAIFAGLFAALNVAADGALNWLEQLNQFGFVFLMLLSFFMLLVALESERDAAALGWAAASALAGYLALWSYESPLPVMFAFPAAVALLRRDVPTRRLAPVLAIYLIPVVAFAAEYAHFYLGSLEHEVGSYQARVSRHNFSLLALSSDLRFHLENSLLPWRWPRSFFYWQRIRDYTIAFIPVLGAIILLIPAAISSEKKSPRPFHVSYRLPLFGAVSLGLLVASYLVILVLHDNRELWRTEFLPGFAAACVLSTILYAVLAAVRIHVWRAAVAILAFSAVGVSATFGAINSGQEFYALWERQRALLATVIANAPQVADDTLFVVRNVNRQHDPFGHNMWLDLALRMAYPGRIIAGIYTFADGRPSPGMSIDIEDGHAHLLPFGPDGSPTLFHMTPNATIKHFLVFDVDPSTGAADPVLEGPVKVGKGEIPASRYDFCAAVIGATPDPIAMHRYGPIPPVNHIPCRRGVNIGHG